MLTNKFFKFILLFIAAIDISCCLDISNNFKEINPTSLKYNSKQLYVSLNCGSLYEFYVDEGAFGAHNDYIFESKFDKVFFLSNSYLHNTGQRFVFNPVDSSIVYFDNSDQIYPSGNLEARQYWFKKNTGNLTPLDSMEIVELKDVMLIDPFQYVDKLYKLDEKNQLTPFLDLEDNEFSWSFENGIYYVGYPGVFYDKKLKLCSLD